MASSEQSDSDPLPFIQWHRSANPKAARLAGKLKVSIQHAKGSLIDFWELCAERRELETEVLEAVRAQREPAIILTADVLAIRFELASGYALEPAVLVALQIVERQEDGRFRVKGMSRQLGVMADLLRSREAGAKGGKASAETRRRKYGTAQPPPVERPVENPPSGIANSNGSRSASASSPPQVPLEGGVEGVPEAVPKPPLKGSRSETEPDVRRETLDVKRGSISSPLEQDRSGGGGEDRNLRWDREAHAFVTWAASLDESLSKPGPDVHDWARGFFRKYQPSDPLLIRAAFAKFLLWCHQDKLTPGWGLWLREKVWEPRWAEVRAEAQRLMARGAA